MLYQWESAVHGVDKLAPAGAVKKLLPQNRLTALDAEQNQAAVLIQVVNLGQGFTDDIVRLEIVDLSLGLVVKYDATGFIRNNHPLIKCGKYG